jgi:hypothetical protein
MLNVWSTDCVVFGGGQFAPVIASGKTLGSQLSKIRARLISSRPKYRDAFLGLSLRFPLPEEQRVNEEAGFGVRYNRTLFVAARWHA